MQTIEETAQTMFHTKFNIRNTLMTVREIKGVIDSIRSQFNNNTEEVSKYNFTGQHTDICFADDNVNIQDINDIENPDIRDNVIKTYNEAVNDEYLEFDRQSGNFSVTDKGRVHINSEAFKTQFEIDQTESISNNNAYIELKGNKSDLDIFRYTDGVNLNNINCTNKKDFNSIVSYFRECEKFGFVKISDDNIVTPTDKCKKFLQQHKPSAKFTINKVTTNNIGDVAMKIAKNRGTEKATEKVAENVAKTSIKVGTKTATGVATAGTTAVVNAIIELSKKGVEALNKLTNLNKGNTPKQSH